MMSWLLLTCLLGLTLAVNGQTTCDNEAQCLESLKKILVDRDKFWFGSNYDKSCPKGPTTSACSNPDVPLTSIASRLFNNSQEQLSSHLNNTKLARIVYNAPNASIFACGHDFPVPAVTSYTVNPLNITRVSAWSLNHKPVVTWDPLPNATLSTVIVWDVGYYFLHGLYVNCANGSMDTGTAAVSYRGPLNPSPTPNVYLTTVFTQLRELNATQVQELLQTFMNGNMRRFKQAVFLETLNTATGDSVMTEPSHINLMTVVADAYSVQKQKERLLVDNCPLLASQQPTLHKVLRGANMSVSLSDNMTSYPDPSPPYVTTLSVGIDVTYSTDDYWVMSCCLNYSITRGSFKADPFSDRTQRAGMTRLKPNVQLSLTDMIPGNTFTDQVYTLFFVDVAPAADATANATNVTVITHWLVGNIRNGDVSTGDEIAQYFGPNPFLPNSPRPYMFMLFKQPVSKLNTSYIESMCPGGVQRCRIDLAKVLQAWNLVELSGVTWLLAENDGFAKMRFYTEIKSRTKEEVCSDVPGYADPCPVPKPCPNKAAHATLPGSLLVGVVAMVTTARSLLWREH
ncbi:unnamed protein product [Lymnaea stagnalis]|uniref:Uncharacterized protein n=1 Tax=Lymnaea stagnalis TaxID=6523 RepID=A0AAV2I6E9_LYMST